jgi:hypothetical protein
MIFIESEGDAACPGSKIGPSAIRVSSFVLILEPIVTHM